MMEELNRWYLARNERERRLVLFGGIAAIVLILLAVFLPLQRRAARLEQDVVRKRADLAWLRSMTPQLAAAAALQPRRNGGHQSLVALVDRQARSLGLGEALIGSQPSGDGGLSVRLEDAGFDSLVALLARLSEQDGVHVESATFEAAKATGHVNASLILRGG